MIRNRWVVDSMREYSRMIIEDYCRTHSSAKSKRINKLVGMSYDMGAMISDGDAAFLEKVIEQEKNLELKEALQELDEFLCE